MQQPLAAGASAEEPSFKNCARCSRCPRGQGWWPELRPTRAVAVPTRLQLIEVCRLSAPCRVANHDSTVKRTNAPASSFTGGWRTMAELRVAPHLARRCAGHLRQRLHCDE